MNSLADQLIELIRRNERAINNTQVGQFVVTIHANKARRLVLSQECDVNLGATLSVPLKVDNQE